MIKLEEHKDLTVNQGIEKLAAPAKVYLPLSQHLGKICAPLVRAADTVLLAQKIAAAQAHVFSPIHSSVSGRVAAIEDWPHPVLGRCKAIAIENDGLDRTENPCLPAGREKPKTEDEIGRLTPEEIRSLVFEAGVVGMGGASFPSHIKLFPPKPVDTLIINAAECEPYLTCDYRLALEKTKEILLGIGLIKKCLAVKNVIIAIEDNKPAAIKAFEEAFGSRFSVLGSRRKPNTEHREPIEGVVLRSQYPQGGEKQLIKNILGKEVPSGKLPFDVGVVVHNVATVFAIYEAVYLNKPLYERVVTVTGSCLTHPKNLLVRIGTPISELIAACGPLKKEPAKIIIGGPMMGSAQYSLEAPVIKSTGGVVLLDKREAKVQEEEFCIRCGACVRACPAGLEPCLINLASEKEKWTEAKIYRTLDCIECGLCNYVCPAHRPLTQSIKRAKLEVAKGGQAA